MGEVPGFVALPVIVIALWVLWHVYSRRIQVIHSMPDIPSTLPADGFPVPVLATFTGVKGTPRQAHISHNNLNPFLVLHEDRIECRVLMKDEIPLARIEKIDIWDTVWTRNLQVYTRGRPEIFSANLLSRRNLAQVLGFLAARGVPLTDRATTFRQANATG
jgi:hypothetical protein